MRVKVQGKVIPASFRKIQGGNAFLSERPEIEGQIEELVGDQNPCPEAPPRSRKGRERGDQKKCQGKSDCQRSNREG